MNIHASLLAASLTLSALAGPAIAEILVLDPYIRTSGPMAKSGAAFMDLRNTGAADDTLLAASSDVAMRVELHTHKDIGDGVMQMIQIEGGMPVPAGGDHLLERGGDHIMFMGLTRSLAQGDIVEVTLTFENAGDINLKIPVDLTQ